MRITRLVQLVLFLSLSICAVAQVTAWSQIYDLALPGWDGGATVITKDQSGNCFVAGYNASRCLISKVDSSGSTVWTTEWGSRSYRDEAPVPSRIVLDSSGVVLAESMMVASS